MKIESFRQTFTKQTNERTKISIYWAPDGAKNETYIILFKDDQSHMYMGPRARPETHDTCEYSLFIVKKEEILLKASLVKGLPTSRTCSHRYQSGSHCL